MPGKLDVGLDAISIGTQSSKSKMAKSYCEGRAAQIGGGSTGDNPHADPKAEAFVSWAEGFNDAFLGLDVKLTGCAL